MDTLVEGQEVDNKRANLSSFLVFEVDVACSCTSDVVLPKTLDKTVVFVQPRCYDRCRLSFECECGWERDSYAARCKKMPQE